MDEQTWLALGAIPAIVTALFTAAMAVAVVTAVYAKGTLAAEKEDSRARTGPALVSRVVNDFVV